MTSQKSEGEMDRIQKQKVSKTQTEEIIELKMKISE